MAWKGGVWTMTGRERMIVAMLNKQPDRVPVAPDISNMIPCRLTGKPFWDIYLFQDPPLWQAYIQAVRYFGFDGWLPSVPAEFPYESAERDPNAQWREAIVARSKERIFTRFHRANDGAHEWSDWCNVYYVADPPTHFVPLEKAGLQGGPPAQWEDVEPRTSYPGLEAYYAARQMMGEDGVVGLSVGLPGLGLQPESIYEYYDCPDVVIERCEKQHEMIVRQTRAILELKPDFILIGVSGHMISNPEHIFRRLSLPTLKEVTALARAAGVPSQVHCCGPEYDLVRIAAEESDLSSINPLETPPMGDCDLGLVKRRFGSKLSLMGNLHTTDVMLRGSVEDVRAASIAAIGAAAEGGGFILSTGDQCGRDTPDENIFAMVEAARTYGVY
ncbi:MAG: uroporphyrinogen decarboxylase family protein [Armatimonadota bacterium]